MSNKDTIDRIKKRTREAKKLASTSQDEIKKLKSDIEILTKMLSQVVSHIKYRENLDRYGQDRWFCDMIEEFEEYIDEQD